MHFKSHNTNIYMYGMANQASTLSIQILTWNLNEKNKLNPHKKSIFDNLIVLICTLYANQILTSHRKSKVLFKRLYLQEPFTINHGFRYHLNCTCIFKSRFHEMTCARQQYICLMAAEIAQYRLYCRSVTRHQIKSNPAAMIELALQPLH